MLYRGWPSGQQPCAGPDSPAWGGAAGRGRYRPADRVPTEAVALAQLNLKLPPAVLSRWKQQAQAAGHESVRDWLLAITATPAEDCAELPLRDRVARLEAAVEALQQAPSPRPLDQPRRPAPPRPEPPPRPAAPLLQEVPEAITTAELAERTGTNRSAWNNWASPDRVGQVRQHPTAGAWRLAGQAAPPLGGPMRWLWLPAGT